MNPSSKLFLVISIFFLVMAVVCLTQGMVGFGIGIAVFGGLGLLAHFNASKKGVHHGKLWD